MRILLTLFSLAKNGANAIALDRAKYWTEWGHSVDLLITASQAHIDQNRDWIPALNAVHQVDAIYPAFRPGTVKGLIKPVRLARQADIVVSGVEIGSSLDIAALAAKIARRPFSVTVQNNLDEAFRTHVPPGRFTKFTRWAIGQADLLVCVSEAQAELTREAGYTSAPIETVINGVDIAKLRANARQASAVPLPSGPYMMALGRLAEQKGFDMLLQAYADAAQKTPSIPDLVIVGDGDEDANLRAQASHLGIADTVHFVGHVDNPAPVLERASLFVLPSRFEGYPLVLAEAMAFGLPIIAFDCPTGPREILQDGSLGALVPSGDVERFAETMLDHLQSPADLKQKADLAMKTCEARFDPAVLARQHLDKLQSLVR